MTLLQKVFSHELTRISSLKPAAQFVLIHEIRGKKSYL